MSFWYHLVLAFGLVLVIEGIIPFLKPDFWRRSVIFLASHTDSFLRRFGLGAMVCGVLIIFFVNKFMMH